MCRTIATKSSDGATTTDKWRFALSPPVTRESSSNVKGALRLC